MATVPPARAVVLSVLQERRMRMRISSGYLRLRSTARLVRIIIVGIIRIVREGYD